LADAYCVGGGDGGDGVGEVSDVSGFLFSFLFLPFLFSIIYMYF